jgi:anti-anti-sigma factor
MTINHFQENGITVVVLEGRLDAVAAPEAEETLLTLAHSANAAVVLDLSGLEYISSTGLQAVIRFAKALAARGWALRLCNPTPFVTEVFEISHLSRYFEILPTRDEALSSVRGGD